MEDLTNILAGVIAIGGTVMPLIGARRPPGNGGEHGGSLPAGKRRTKWIQASVFFALGLCWFFANRAVQQKNASESAKNARELASLRATIVDLDQKRKEEKENSDRMQLASLIAISPDSKKSDLLKIAKEKGWSTEHVHIKEGISVVATTAWGIPQDDFQMLSDQMAPYATPYERGDLIVAVRGEDASENLAKYLADSFRAAGWSIPDYGFLQVDGRSTGVIIAAKSGKSNPPGAYAIISFLRRYGIEPTLRVDRSIPDDRFRIVVGGRPREIAEKMKRRAGQ